MNLPERVMIGMDVLFRGGKDVTAKQLMEAGEWVLAKQMAKTPEDFLALGYHRADPLGTCRAGRGDYTPEDTWVFAITQAQVLAREANRIDIFKELMEKAKAGYSKP